MMTIIPAGRTDIDNFFRKSGVFDVEHLNHTPLLVFAAKAESVEVRLIHKPRELLSYPDNTPVMGQWRGEWRSDWFQFTVGQYRAYEAARQEPLKSARNVVKTYGPREGVRRLTFEYIDKRGIHVYKGANTKTEIERLEDFFRAEGIDIKIEFDH